MMDNKRIQKLQSISEFPELVSYLRDELDWPIETDKLDELTFDYELDELGIDEANAAKVLKIRRMRPLDINQPWGIFFLELEPKKLPIVVLRKILSKVVLKNRASSNKSNQTAWKSDDILFVSNFGERGDRQISFVHFATPENRKDLPVVKVLGWDEDDTKLKIDWIARQLQSHLQWPDKPYDLEGWRKNWSKTFTLRHRQEIHDAETMALELAKLAKRIRQRIHDVLAVETVKGPMTRLMKAFRESLVSDLDADGFADMYAQTIAYGLLSARIADPSKKSVDDLAAHMRTSPFLRELMEQFLYIGGRKGKAGGPGIDFDELGISDVIELLDDTDMEAVIRNFGDRNKQEDPVMHFFEGFLQAYDKKIKKERGVFYTPQPVVSYIVRSIHELLQTEFGLEDGLADITTWGEMLKKHPGLKLPLLNDEPGEKRTISPDEPFVQILDPATGTGTFLVEVIDVIHSTLTAKWQRQRLTEPQRLVAWNDYVPTHLLPRLHAFELMMAPYAIAHMKISLKLVETGYRFDTEERARIYLTNALEPWVKQLPLIGFEALAHEAVAVNLIKRHKRFTVVLGNPPYSISSDNKGEWIQSLTGQYKQGLNEINVNSLSDDYVKFIRFAEYTLGVTLTGVLGMITNNSYLEGTIHRLMRESLLETFQEIYICDLHGSSIVVAASERGKDENVFDIQQGVAIGIFARPPSPGHKVTVQHTELIGERAMKYAFLQRKNANTINYENLKPHPPAHFLKPKDFSLELEYFRFWALGTIFSVIATGINFRKDSLLIRNHFSPKDAATMVKDVNELPTEALLEKYNFAETSDWQLAEKRQYFCPERVNDIRRIAYRPFSDRFAYYPLDVVDKIIVRGDSRLGTAKHLMLTPNLALIFKRSRVINVSYFCHISVVDAPPDGNYLADRTHFAPLYSIHPKQQELELFPLDGSTDHVRTSNISGELVSHLCSLYGLDLVNEGSGDLIKTYGPVDVFNYVYGVLHSLHFRERYADFLKTDFPRIPFSSNLQLFQQLASFGSLLVALHLSESNKMGCPSSQFIGNNHQVARVGWTPHGGGTVWLDGKGTKANFQAGTSGFHPVPEEVWDFHIGGYQVCEKWLKDRGPKKGKPGRTLTDEDIAHYHKIVIALTETIRLMAEIDEVINLHGGWPGAFITEADPDHREYQHLMAADSD